MRYKYCFFLCTFALVLFEMIYPRSQETLDVTRALWAGYFAGFLGWVGLVLDRRHDETPH